MEVLEARMKIFGYTIKFSIIDDCYSKSIWGDK